jgi:hypothetical protein
MQPHVDAAHDLAAPPGASCSLITSIANCMSFLNPAGVRIAKFFGSSSRLTSTILKFGGSTESPFAPVTKNGG